MWGTEVTIEEDFRLAKEIIRNSKGLSRQKWVIPGPPLGATPKQLQFWKRVIEATYGIKIDTFEGKKI